VYVALKESNGCIESRHPGSANEPFFKVLKDSPENFRDLSILSDCDTDDTIDAARKLVCRLYDQKGKLKEDHVDFNKLWVRLATLRDACLAKLPPCEDTFTQHVLRGGYFHCGINRQFGKGKGLCKIDFAQNKCILSCTQIFLCKYKQFKVLQKIRRHLAFT
jgi:hypothetical protein